MIVSLATYSVSSPQVTFEMKPWVVKLVQVVHVFFAYLCKQQYHDFLFSSVLRLTDALQDTIIMYTSAVGTLATVP